MAGWIKALGMSSVPVLSSRCLCLTGCFASLPWLSAAGEGLGRAGRKARTPSVWALFGLLCSCPGKAQFVHGAFLLAGSLGSQSMNGIKRSCTSPWLVAHEWLLNEVSDTWTPRFLAVGRTTGRTAVLALLSR